ncbi:MAG TPA: alpha-amylase family glycosyl hydrolase [Acidobacteriaceae bacterium]|nr:alpha-amylase family glycosyl hydrolase [Acidobacteriaceae bacterium]
MLLRFAALLGCCCATLLPAQTPRIDKIDPPNWWVEMPAPMLLVRGEGLSGARFSFSDGALGIQKTVVSDNGHWAQLWLMKAPVRPERVTIRVSRGSEHADAMYEFGARKSPTAGFAGFSSSDVMYLIMTDRFADGDLKNDGPHAEDAASSSAAAAERAKPRGWHGGDYRGIEQHLDYLQQLGVTAVWITPPYENLGAESYHGYHATDMYRVDPHWGSMVDLQALADALHKRHMKLVLDTVPNHVGPLHPWVQDEPTPNWFHGTAAHHIAGETNFEALIDSHAPERDRIGTLDGWFVDSLPDMDTDDATVAKYLRQNAVWWIEETGADALRIDTFPYVDRQFWHEFMAEIAALYPRVTAVGEVSDGNPVINSSFAGGVTRAGVDTGLYTPFDYPEYYAAQDTFVKGAPMKRLADVLGQDSLYPHPDRLVPFLDNHDQKRFAEQIPDASLDRVAFAYLLTMRGTPQLYAGDEIAMKGGSDPDNRRDFPGGFPGASQDAFTQAGRTPEEQTEFSWIGALTKLRRDYAALACGGEQVLAADNDWLVTLRDMQHNPAERCEAKSGAHPHERVIVALHRGTGAAALDVPTAKTWAEGCRLSRPLLGEGRITSSSSPEGFHLSLNGNDVLIAACE